MHNSWGQRDFVEESINLRDNRPRINLGHLRPWPLMPYGLSSAPSAFQKIVTSVLSGIPGVLNLLDDMVVCGANTEEHNHRLQEVLSRLAKHQFTLNEEKCKFAASEIDFVGYRVTAEGMMPTHDNAATIQRLWMRKNSRLFLVPLISTWSLSTWTTQQNSSERHTIGVIKPTRKVHQNSLSICPNSCVHNTYPPSSKHHWID